MIALDGPAGAGKSTVAKLVAERSGLPYLDTGAMYRAITVGILSRGIDPSDWPAIDEALASIELEIDPDRVMVDGIDATLAIRGPEATAGVSAVAANPTVRASLVGLQRRWVERQGGGVLEGRDIGTVVVPGAGLKVFVTASVRERARRRSEEIDAPIDEVEADLTRRDALDSARAESPLKPAEDAVIVDTTEHTIDEVVAIIIELATQRGVL